MGDLGLRFCRGLRFVVLRECGNGLCLARECWTGQKGLLPLACLRPANPQTPGAQADAALVVAAVDCGGQLDPGQAASLEVVAGACMWQLAAEEDGWFPAECPTTGRSGLVPFASVRPMKAKRSRKSL
mmetsp:Transcript_128913/g.294277  ORF Transcript_128913/g.294277 Transcript_128913/m.294277 type:complete len:128 (-) Transcript_128913:81-464(-)